MKHDAENRLFRTFRSIKVLHDFYVICTLNAAYIHIWENAS